jgi:TonB family protein
LAVSYLRLACLSAKAGKQDESKAEESHAREILKSVADKHGPVEGGVINGKALSKPQPPYPDIAKRASAQGTIEVQILISETGNVLAACARGDGNPALKRASELAAYRAKFAPTTIDGKPVKVIGVITYKFVLF